MTFDVIAKSVASTLSGVFGGTWFYTRPHAIDGLDPEFTAMVPAILRRNAEIMDDEGRVMVIDYVFRIARSDVDFTPRRGDTLAQAGITYQIGRAIQSDEYAFEYEASRK